MSSTVSRRKRASKTMLYIGIGIIIVTSGIAGLLFWQGRSLRVEGTPPPCPSINSSVQNSAGGFLVDGAPVCLGGDWKKRRQGDTLEKSALTVALSGTALGLVSIGIGAILGRVRLHR